MIIPQFNSFYQIMNDPQNTQLVDKLVYTDTSFVYELFGKSDNPVRQEECKNFSTYLASIGAVMVTSPKVHEELRIMLVPAFLSQYRDYKDQPIKEVMQNKPDIVKLAKQKVKEVTEALKQDPNFLHLDLPNLDLDYLENIVDPIFEENSLLFPDAFHYAFAKNQGITDLASLDRDYVSINDPNFCFITDTGRYLTILIESNSPVPDDLLIYYIEKCNKFGYSIPKSIYTYYTNLQRLKNRWSSNR